MKGGFRAEAVALKHDTFSRNAGSQLKPLQDAMRKPMLPDSLKRPIGFITAGDKGENFSDSPGKL